MSLELNRETIRVSQAICQDSVQTVIENDIIVPDAKPDIANILILDGDVCINSCEVMQDKVLINGTLNFKILYTPDDPGHYLKSINTSSPFSYGMEMPNSRQGMKSVTKCSIEHLDSSILNGRKINVKAILNIDVRVLDESELEIIDNISGIDNIQILRNKTAISTFLGFNETQHTLRETLEIPASKPAIAEILRNDIKITGKDYKIADNKIIAKGDLNIATMYMGEGENQSIQFMENEIPFTQFIDFPDINEDAGCELDFDIIDSQFSVQDDSDGEPRAIGAEVNIRISARSYRSRMIDIIEDAYSPRIKLGIEKKSFIADDIFAEDKSQLNLRETVVLDEESPEITEVFNVLSKPVLTECKLSDDKAVIEGVIECNVLYASSSTDQPVCCHKQEIPFKHSVDIKGLNQKMHCDIFLDTDHSNYSMISANEVEIRMAISVTVKAVNQVSIPIIVKVSEAPVDDKKLSSMPSIIIYYSQPEDTLWEIAKKYYTTVEDLVRINNISEDDTLEAGRQIFIPGNAS